MKRFRVLLLAEMANPRMVSVPLVGWSHCRAIARRVDAHMVTQVRNRQAILDAGLVEGKDFTAIDSERFARPMMKLAGKLRGGSGKGWTTVMALTALAYPYFERLAWKQFGPRIVAGEFDLVHRVTPLSPTLPSYFAKRCAKAGVPFILGPLNGGVPWPRQFDSARRREREWLSYFRGVYRFMPGYTTTRRHASALLIGSADTLAQMPKRYHDKCVYIPENAIEPERFPAVERRATAPPLRVVFIGRLVPYKGLDMLIEAVAPLMREGKLKIDVIGDGPERQPIEQLIERERVGQAVAFAGWLAHDAIARRVAEAHVLGFPSIREFGGGVVLEAMALGVVPVIVDYGGPAELVTPDTGFAVPMGTRKQIVERLSRTFSEICDAPQRLPAMSAAAMDRVSQLFTWDAKAGQTLEVYRWVLGQRSDKPDFGRPLQRVGADALSLRVGGNG